MMNNIFLTPEEIHTLTKRSYRPAQAKVLREMGIDHKIHPDGDVLILRSHINKVFNGDESQKPSTESKEPNWGAFNTCA